VILRRNKKIISILVTLSFLLTLLVPMSTAFAATNNFAETTPWVQDGEDKELGTLVISEDEDLGTKFRKGDVVTIFLPEGVEYSTPPSVAEGVYYVDSDDIELTVIAGADNYVSFEITADGSGNDKIKVYFGADGKASTVDIDSGVTGDIDVEISAAGTTVTSEFVTVARIVEGDTTTTISSVKTIGLGAVGAIGTIRIQENAAGVLKANDDYIKLVLPSSKYEWVKGDSEVSSANLNKDGNEPAVEFVDDSFGTRTLEIKVNDTSSSQPGFITLSGLEIDVDDSAKEEEEVEVTIKGNEVTEEDIVVAKTGDFGFDVYVDGDVETIIAGRTGEELPTIVIDEVVADSWIAGRTVKFELPSWAEFANQPSDNDVFDGAPKLNSKKDELRYTVKDGASDEAELDFEVKIDADAPEGDLVLKISGSAGVEDELVVAEIVKPFSITAGKPGITIGERNQQLGDIILTEAEDGALEEDIWVVFEAPAGITFADTPAVEVTDGDLEVDDEDARKEYFAFRIDEESNKEAGTIEISGIEFDVDRTLPAGDIAFDVYLIASEIEEDDGDIIETKDIYDIEDNEKYLEKVTSVVVGTIVAEGKSKAEFVIGETTYTLNGEEQTMDVAPYIKNDRTYMPVRFVAYAAGISDDNIMWNQAEQSVVMIKGDRVVKMFIGSNTMLINGVEFVMDVAPELVDPGRTMLPVRWVAQALGCSVEWDEATRTVTVN
jgi:hypothetical protein